MAPPPSADPDEHSIPDCSKKETDGSYSPWKSIKSEDGRNWSYTDTASLTCSDSLNSSLTDTDEETCSLSPDNSLKTRHSRLSPIAKSTDLPQRLNAIEDLSFEDECLPSEAKIHAPSKLQKCRTARRRLVWAIPLVIAGVICYRFSRKSRRGHHGVDPLDWKRFLHDEAPQIRRHIETSTIPESFSVRLSGSRSDLLTRSVDVLTRCPFVEEIQVEWMSSMRPPRKLFRHPSGKVVHVERLVTNAVLLLDEDVMFTCSELERGFNLWRLNMDRMVGFFPYHHALPDRQPLLDLASSPSTDPVVPGGGNYELVSSRGAFVHKEYLESFGSTQDSACIPFTLSVHCSAISAKPPLAVVSDPQEQRTSDIVPLLDNQKWTRDEVSSCLTEWIEGHDISSLPSEESTYLGA